MRAGFDRFIKWMHDNNDLLLWVLAGVVVAIAILSGSKP